MCVAAFAWHPGAATPLILLHNRDEYYARPSQPLALRRFGSRSVACGLDETAGGTWLAAAPGGRLAFVTNLRRGPAEKAPRSRGTLVRDFIGGDAPFAEFVAGLVPDIALYGGFCMVGGSTTGDLAGCSAWVGRAEPLSAGIHTVSNAGVDQGWPKERRLAEALRDTLSHPASTPREESLLQLLGDSTPALDADLPDTGIGGELERLLSPIFVALPGYGTRASTLIVGRRDGSAVIRERSFGEGGRSAGERRLEIPPGQSANPML